MNAIDLINRWNKALCKLYGVRYSAPVYGGTTYKNEAAKAMGFDKWRQYIAAERALQHHYNEARK